METEIEGTCGHCDGCGRCGCSCACNVEGSPSETNVSIVNNPEGESAPTVHQKGIPERCERGGTHNGDAACSLGGYHPFDPEADARGLQMDRLQPSDHEATHDTCGTAGCPCPDCGLCLVLRPHKHPFTKEAAKGGA